MNELEQRLAGSPTLVVLQLQAKEAARLVSRDTNVPAGWLALAKRTDGRVAVVPAGADLHSQSSDVLSMFKAGPICLTVKAGPIRTADGHEITCTVTLRAAVRPEVNDLNGLTRQFLSRSKPVVEVGDIEEYLQEYVLVGARVFCRGRSTAENLAPTTASSLADHMAESLERPLLSVGLAQVPGMMVTCMPISHEAISFLEPAGNAAGQEVLHKALLGQFDDLAEKAAACGEVQVAEALRKLRDKVAGQVAFTTFEQVVQVLPEKVRVDLHERADEGFGGGVGGTARSRGRLAGRLLETAGDGAACLDDEPAGGRGRRAVDPDVSRRAGGQVLRWSVVRRGWRSSMRPQAS